MALRHVIDAVNARGGIPRIDAIPERVTCSSSSRKHLRRVQRSCDFNLVTSYVCQQLKLCVTLHVCPTVALCGFLHVFLQLQLTIILFSINLLIILNN